MMKQNKFETYSKYFIVFAILGIFAFDGVMFLKGGQDATISSVIIKQWSYEYPAFVFGIGFIMGHLFWPLSKNKFEGGLK